jgi:acetylornithine deacetylase/succinyl-diaminopimelate desuccinylase-like protein
MSRRSTKRDRDLVHHAAQLDLWLRENPPVIEWKLHWPPFDIPEDYPICNTIGAAHENASRGSSFEGPAALAGFYAVDDGAFLTANGIPAVTYGTGSIHHAHMVDEFVNIDELVVSTRAYALAAMDWCGVAQ